MHWHIRLAALFVMFTLVGCARGKTGQGQAPYPAHSPESNGTMPERGGGDGGGGGGSM
jgi:hypothetical protein